MSCCRIDGNKNTHAVLGHSKDKKMAYIVLEENRLEEALDVLKKSFYPFEPACTLLEVAKSEEAVKELNLLMVDVAKDKISVAAIDTQTDRLVGVCFNKIQIKPKAGELAYFEKFKRQVSKNEKAIKLIDFMSEVDAEVDIFGKFNTDRAAELVFLAVLPTHRHRGIGLDLMIHSLNLFKTKAVAKVACMIGTSVYTQRIGARLNFESLAQLPYEKGDASDSIFEEVSRLHARSVLFARHI